MTTVDESRPWRCFVAVPLPAGLRAALADWVADVRRSPALDADWRWSDPGGWHVTLAFLGATLPDAVPTVVDRLSRDLGGWPAFSVAAGWIGGFPGQRRARVLWYGVRDEERRLEELAHSVRVATEVDEADPFRPHVTLARASDRHGAPIPSLLTDRLPAGEIPVASVSLMRSHLGHGPAQYETLAEVPLGAAVAASVSASAPA